MTSTEEISLSRRDIFLMIESMSNAEVSEKVNAVEVAIQSKIQAPFTLSTDSRNRVRNAIYKLQERWRKSYRDLSAFYKQNDPWLEEKITLFNAVPTINSSPESKTTGNRNIPQPLTPENASQKIRGRPSKEFEEGSDRTKRRKATNLAGSHSTTQLAYATEMSLRRSGSHDAAVIVKEASNMSPRSAKSLRSSSSVTIPKEMLPEVALSLIVETSSTVNNYNKYRSISLQYNAPIFPSYKKVLQAKKKCYPEGIIISETCAYVPLQCLLDHTVERILSSQFEVIRNLSEGSVAQLQLYVKWGCDGSSGQSQYKQSFSDDSVSDASMFMTSLSPLRLVSNDSANNLIIWKNPRPSSPRYCRPIKVEFMMESASTIVKEKERVESEIKSLISYETCMDGKSITVQYKMVFTMIDGKVCNAISNTKSAMRCYLCGVTSKDFNRIDFVLSKNIEDSYLCYGMSTLHAWIRFMECLLHIGYRIGVNVW